MATDFLRAISAAPGNGRTSLAALFADQARAGRRRNLLARLLSIGILPLLAFSTVAYAEAIPTSGSDIPSLNAVDQWVTNFMAKYSVPGGAVGLVRDGRLLFVRGYGYADTTTREIVQPDSLFRLASLSKAITAASVLRLVEHGRLDLDQPAFAILNYPAPTYAGAALDPRLSAITVRHLLNHTGGWNRNTALNPEGGVGFDPTVSWTTRAAADMGTTTPADAETVVRWMIGKPLQFAPGTEYQYSNFGYTVLGRIVERVTGTNYEAFIRGVLAEAGISRLRVSGSRQPDRLAGEVSYYDYPGAELTKSIFPTDQGLVAWPYNFDYHTMDAHGGLAASAIDLLRFVSAVDGRASYPDILTPGSVAAMTARPSPPWGTTTEPYYGMGWLVRNTPGNWWHDGSLPGTRTEMVRAGNGFTWVLLFNTRVRNDNAFATEMDNLGWNILAAVKTWPSHDLFDATLSYEAWRLRYFPAAELKDPATSGAGSDPDNDRVPNLIEYALGSAPKDATSTARVAGAIESLDEGRFLTLRFRRRMLAHEVDYVIEVSSNLVHWSATAQPIGSPVLDTDGYQVLAYRDETPAAPQGARFMRLTIARRDKEDSRLVNRHQVGRSTP